MQLSIMSSPAGLKRQGLIQIPWKDSVCEAAKAVLKLNRIALLMVLI